ncbi:TPA: hypothetical protein NGT26_003158 [Vibrio parahaemolyticus]|nr:hypothetical protein [Vibrio parahaemolyticus]HCE2195138.1 hypothetical protein [Vibrio parahaemolyticus]HCG6674111.1 hypothetical protein [Vibrio parahaemolyticus]HCG7224905.1 hypothetical protein [Vibrio parahaemolyticus]HCG7318983.1 hypothetical protein [Vibrio parahaemolyticus]
MAEQDKQIKRYYTEKDVKRLVTLAGGRCSYRHDGEICKRLLVSNNSVIGEKAHIEAIGKKGARHNPGISETKVNSYDNLMWMCPTHHTMIDKLDDQHIYTVEVLLKMKSEHEKDIARGNYSTGITLYDTIIHDYTALSTLFYYVDINKLYSSSIELPYYLGKDFGELEHMTENYKLDLGPFYLQDKYLNKLFVRMLDSERSLSKNIHETFRINAVFDGENPVEKSSCELQSERGFEHIKWIDHLTCEYQENVDNFLNAIRNRYPEILCAPVFDPFPDV